MVLFETIRCNAKQGNAEDENCPRMNIPTPSVIPLLDTAVLYLLSQH